MVVSFCGHRNVYDEIEKLIVAGVDTFYFGSKSEFDRFCYVVVSILKEKYPHIVSVLVIPYINKDYDKSLYDISEYPPIENVPKRLAIIKRNRWMVDKSDVVVAYIRNNFGGAAMMFDYAERKDVATNCRIPVFSIDAVETLLDWRN